MTFGKQYWEEVIGEEWTKELTFLLKEPYMLKVLTFLQSKNIKIPNLFKNLKKCSYSNLKLIILTETPLSTGDYTRIKECIEREYCNNLFIEFDDSFDFLNDQSVLFLSKSLTIKEHLPQWNKFTNTIINHVCKEKPEIIFFIWDENLNILTETLSNDIIVYSWEHPSKNKFNAWKCPNFKDLDKLFLYKKQKHIIWFDKIK